LGDFALKHTVQSLFSPFSFKNLTLTNRIVMAPMTREFALGGVPGPDIVAYYRRRAENGVGLIVTEGTMVNHPAASSSPNCPYFYGEEALAGWAKVVKAVHEVGGRIVPQLWHVGMQRKIGSLPNPDSLPVGPSGLNIAGEKITEPMSEAEILAVVEAFGEAAGHAKRLGFDGIEIHGAHGYLIDQFFWEKTNQRTDRYGGNLVKRTRFAVEIIEACRQAVGPDFPIIFRLSQWKAGDYSARLVETPSQLEEFLTPLVDAGVDIFHCSTRRFWEPEFAGSDLNWAGWIKKLTGKPTITVGNVGLRKEFFGSLDGQANLETGIDNLVMRLEKGEFDLVAVGRALISDYAWAAKVRDNRVNEINLFKKEDLNSTVLI
jgi:2,4-dienoyl-CoA reductase-like NADH-dependent reductase (Old Yellow Enzyme family)